MHDIIERFREALAHATLESIFGHSIADEIGGFAGSIAADIVAGIVLTLIIGAAGWFAWFELPGRLRAWTIRRGDRNRLNILVARFEGEGGRDIRDHIREQMRNVFGEVTRRPFDVFYFPVTLRDIDSGSEKSHASRVERKGRRWMQRARANLLIWGRAHKSAEKATIYFLYEEVEGARKYLSSSDEKTVERSGSKPQGTKTYNFASLPNDFGADLARAVGFAAANCVRGVFDADYVRQLKPEIARSLTRKLEPFLDDAAKGIPEDLRTEIRANYASASEGLGRQGMMEGWEQVFHTLQEDLGKIDKKADAENWASAASILAAAFLEAGEQFGVNKLIAPAIGLYRETLDLRVRERVPLDWAMTQNNLGNALQALGERETGTTRLEEAVAAFRAALEETTRERVPLEWARTQNNLGVALRTLGRSETGTARLEDAVAAYRAALEERTRERVPLSWASTQNNLGNALQTLGERETGTARLEEAVAAFRAALEEITRERVPLGWAMIQSNLGTALRNLGAREARTARLQEAVAAFRAALEEITRERVPLDWATTQNNLGAALETLGERQTGTAGLEEAVAAYRAAIEILDNSNAEYPCEIARQNLRRIEAMLPEKRWRDAQSV